jgi:1-acyl-sn-glycerol-3-phosphate acyltransferase
VPPPPPPRIYRFAAFISRPVLHGLYRLRASGVENVPLTGGCVLACNHLSNFDPWPLGMPLWPHRWLRFMAKSELYWWPQRLVLNAAGAFRVRRGIGDMEAIATAIQFAREGHVVVMFPEGTRRKKGLVKKHRPRARSGAARIALEAGVPLIPAALAGTDHLLGLGPLRVAFGAPIEMDDLSPDDLRRSSQTATERLMAQINELEASL